MQGLLHVKIVPDRLYRNGMSLVMYVFSESLLNSRNMVFVTQLCKDIIDELNFRL